MSKFFEDDETTPLQNKRLSTHEQLFTRTPQINLRTIENNPAKSPCIAMQMDRLTKRAGIFSQHKTVRLTEIECDYLLRPTAVLELVENNPQMAYYRGDTTYMGYYMTYDVRIRGDVDFSLRRQDIIAIAEVIRTERLEGFAAALGLRGNCCVTHDVYNIYSSEWEAQQ